MADVISISADFLKPHFISGTHISEAAAIHKLNKLKNQAIPGQNWHRWMQHKMLLRTASIFSWAQNMRWSPQLHHALHPPMPANGINQKSQTIPEHWWMQHVMLLRTASQFSGYKICDGVHSYIKCCTHPCQQLELIGVLESCSIPQLQGACSSRHKLYTGRRQTNSCQTKQNHHHRNRPLDTADHHAAKYTVAAVSRVSRSSLRLP